MISAALARRNSIISFLPSLEVQWSADILKIVSMVSMALTFVPKAALFKILDYGVHHPESSQGGGIKNKNKKK